MTLDAGLTGLSSPAVLVAWTAVCGHSLNSSSLTSRLLNRLCLNLSRYGQSNIPGSRHERTPPPALFQSPPKAGDTDGQPFFVRVVAGGRLLACVWQGADVGNDGIHVPRVQIG